MQRIFIFLLFLFFEIIKKTTYYSQLIDLFIAIKNGKVAQSFIEKLITKMINIFPALTSI